MEGRLGRQGKPLCSACRLQSAKSGFVLFASGNNVSEEALLAQGSVRSVLGSRLDIYLRKPNPETYSWQNLAEISLCCLTRPPVFRARMGNLKLSMCGWAGVKLELDEPTYHTPMICYIPFLYTYKHVRKVPGQRGDDGR